MLDIFRGDAFSLQSLTESMEVLPYVPSRLGQSGWFRQKGITTLSAVIEEREGKLSLLPVAARGTMPTYETRPKRKMRSFIVPHIPCNDAVMADEVQGVRAFGSETAVETVSEVVNEKLAQLKQDHEVTWEYHRIGAIQGVIKDADGSSVIYNLFDEYDITETVIDIDPATDDLKLKALEVIRTMETLLGAGSYREIRAIAGDAWWDDFINNPELKDAFRRYQENSFARQQQDRAGFSFADITWENYRGKVGNVDFIDTDTVRFVPVGVPNLFMQYNAPANFMETVNTVGKPYYAKQEPMRFDVGVELHTQSNPLFICTRPSLLIKGARDSSSSSA